MSYSAIKQLDKSIINRTKNYRPVSANIQPAGVILNYLDPQVIKDSRSSSIKGQRSLRKNEVTVITCSNGKLKSRPQVLSIQESPARSNYYIQVISHTKNNFIINNYYQNINYGIEWEKVQEESLQIKEIFNTTKNENIRLKTRNSLLEKEIQKAQRLIEEMDSQGIQKHLMKKNCEVWDYNQFQIQQSTLINLKNQIKDLRNQIYQKDDELLKLKKSVKCSRLAELETEKKAYIDETIRLRQLMQQFIEQQAEFERNEQEFRRLEQQIEKKEQNLQKLKSQYYELDSENKNNIQKNLYLQSINDQLKADISKIQQQSQNKIKTKDTQIIQLKNEIARYHKLLEQTLNQTQTKKQIPSNNNTNRNSPKRKSESNNCSTLMNHQLHENVSSSQEKQKTQPSSHINKINAPVRLNELKDVCKNKKILIILGFGIKMKKIDDYLFKNESKQTQTIKQISMSLQGSIFSLPQHQAYLVARYLVESINQVYPYAANDNLQQNISLIRATFLRAVGLWSSFDQVESKVIELQLCKKLSDINLKTILAKQKEINYQKLLDLINDQLVQKKQPELKLLEQDYIISKVIVDATNLDKINRDSIITLIQGLSQQDQFDQTITCDELERYYEAINDKISLTDKQISWQQQTLLNYLNSLEDHSISQHIDVGDEDDNRRMKIEQLLNQGFLRSYTEPDQYQLQQFYQEDPNNQEPDSELDPIRAQDLSPDRQQIKHYQPILNDEDDNEQHEDFFQQDEDDADEAKWENTYESIEGKKIRYDRGISKGKSRDSSVKQRTISHSVNDQLKNDNEGIQDSQILEEQVYELDDFEDEQQQLQ